MTDSRKTDIIQLSDASSFSIENSSNEGEKKINFVYKNTEDLNQEELLFRFVFAGIPEGYSTVLMSQEEPKIENMQLDTLIALKEDNQLIIYWIENGKKVNRAFSETAVQSIIQNLPAIGMKSTDSELIKEITSQYGCSYHVVRDMLFSSEKQQWEVSLDVPENTHGFFLIFRKENENLHLLQECGFALKNGSPPPWIYLDPKVSKGTLHSFLYKEDGTINDPPDLCLMPSIPTLSNLPQNNNSAYVLVQSVPGTAPTDLYFVDRSGTTPIIKQLTFLQNQNISTFTQALFPSVKNNVYTQLSALSATQLQGVTLITGHTQLEMGEGAFQ